MVASGNPGDGSEADARHPSLAPRYCVGDKGEQGAPEQGWGGGRGRGRGGGRGGRRGALRALTACLPCSPRRGDSWDRWRRPPALGASLPAAPPQRRARRHAAAPAPRGALDLHRVRLDLGPGPGTPPCLSLGVHVRGMGTIRPVAQKASHLPGTWLGSLSPTPHHRASLGGRPCVGTAPQPH